MCPRGGPADGTGEVRDTSASARRVTAKQDKQTVRVGSDREGNRRNAPSRAVAAVPRRWTDPSLRGSGVWIRSLGVRPGESSGSAALGPVAPTGWALG